MIIKNTSRRVRRRPMPYSSPSAVAIAVGACLLGGAGFNSQALAQDQEADEVLDEVVATGSRIPRTGFETLQPATVLDSEQLQARGTIDIATALNEQAGFAVPTVAPIDTQNADEIGQSFVDYLGLGQQRTLTLVNGQRFPAGVSPTSVGGLSVDLNAIPEILVERIETIAVGGAPIYGSDAVSGTVNIILRDDFEGLELFGQTGTSPRFNDAARTRLGAVWGKNFDNGRGNIVLSGQYTSADGLKQTDRPATATGIGFEAPADPNSPFANQLFDDLTVAVDNLSPFPLFSGNQFAFNIFGNGIPLDINDPNSPVTQFDDDGNLLPFVPGGGTGSVIFQNGGDGLKLASLSSLYTDSERANANIFFNYDITDRLRFNAEAWYTKVDSTEIINQPIFNSPAFGGLPGDGFGDVNSGPIPVLINNPFIPAGTLATITSALNVVHDTDGDGIADPTIDTDGDGVADAVGFWRGGPLTGVVGDNADSTRRELLRGVVGVEGDVTVGDRDLTWDAYFTYGRSKSLDRSLTIIQERFEQAIQVVPDANGNPVCADPSNNCVPLNVIGSNTREAVNFVSALTEDEVVIEQRVFAANLVGDVLDLPAGPIGAAVGFMYREESAQYDPNDIAENGFARNTLVPINGEFDSTEFYLEAVVPLLGGDLDTPLVQGLDFEGAIRFVDNSVAGNDTTWTAGLRYRPVDDIELRGNFTESIRAPSITELFTPESTRFAFANDPCDERFIDQGNVPATRAANCASDGIAQPFQSFIVNASQEVTLSGNQSLDSEVAESETFGIVIRPRFLEGFTASFDWFDIEIANAIENLTAQDILVACYDSSAFPNEPSCDLFDRDAAGQVAGVSTGFVNVGLVEFAGLQTAMNYSFDMGRFGDMRISLNHLFTERHRETPGSGNTNVQEGEVGRAEHRITASTIWSKGDWRVFNQFRWLDGVVFDNADDATSRDVLGFGSWFTVDTSIAYALNDNIDLQLNIDNLLDRDAPYAAAASANGPTSYFSGVLERYATFTVRARF